MTFLSEHRSEPGACGARTRAGGYCRRRPLKGERRCGLHGESATRAYHEILRSPWWDFQVRFFVLELVGCGFVVKKAFRRAFKVENPHNETIRRFMNHPKVKKILREQMTWLLVHMDAGYALTRTPGGREIAEMLYKKTPRK